MMQRCELKRHWQNQKIKQKHEVQHPAKPFKPGMLRFPRSSLDVRQSVGNFKSGSAQLVPLKWSWHPCVISELFCLDVR